MPQWDGALDVRVRYPSDGDHHRAGRALDRLRKRLASAIDAWVRDDLLIPAYDVSQSITTPGPFEVET